jgi:hypothetical protein
MYGALSYDVFPTDTRGEAVFHGPVDALLRGFEPEPREVETAQAGGRESL